MNRRVVTLATGEIAEEQRYGLTSRHPHQFPLDTLLQRWQGHWGIENRLHWVKDVVFGEDAARIRPGQAPLILATSRTPVVSLLHALGFASLTHGIRHLALNLDEDLACVCGVFEGPSLDHPAPSK